MNEMKKLYIVGAGGFGREVAWLAERINEKQRIWSIQGFIDDNPKKHGKREGNYRVLGSCADLENYGDCWAVCAVGTAHIRKNIVEKLQKYSNVKFATLIDPSVIFSDTVQIGEGSIICAGNILTVNITIGRYVIINLDCTVGHDAVIEDFVTIYPGVHISGNSTIEAEAELGTGLQIIQGKHIGREAIIGAGAVVIRDIPACCTAVGNPARPIKIRE